MKSRDGASDFPHSPQRRDFMLGRRPSPVSLRQTEPSLREREQQPAVARGRRARSEPQTLGGVASCAKPLSVAPKTLPVWGLTRCTRPQAGQVTASKLSSSRSVGSFAIQPCTRRPVFGQRYRKVGNSIPEMPEGRDHWLWRIRFDRGRPNRLCAEADSFVRRRCCLLDPDQGGNARTTCSLFEAPGLTLKGVSLAISAARPLAWAGRRSAVS